MRNRWFFLSLALLALCLFVPQKSFAQSTVSCNSDDRNRQTCAADTRGGVTLATQHSNSACTQGYSWGYDNQGIWVDHGCRADFTVGSNRDYQRGRNGQYGRNGQDDRDRQNNGYGQTQTISCSSNDMRRHSCAVDTRGGVTLARQLSKAAAPKVIAGVMTTGASGWTTDAAPISRLVQAAITTNAAGTANTAEMDKTTETGNTTDTGRHKPFLVARMTCGGTPAPRTRAAE